MDRRVRAVVIRREMRSMIACAIEGRISIGRGEPMDSYSCTRST
jgi:hypothetical protein